MNKAIIDTTILTDILLNSGEVKSCALNALNSFKETMLPVYAIKEFKAGPLKNFAWMHNKLISVGSFSLAIDSLQRMARTPKRYTTSTAIQALKEAADSIGNLSLGDLQKKYGTAANTDLVLYDEFRLHIKARIMIAWKKRRSLTSNIVHPLLCYREQEPYEERGMIELKPTECVATGDCSMAKLLKGKSEELTKMRDAIKNSEKQENKERARILHDLARKPNMPIAEKDCRKLGDAIFVFLAPKDSVILTTNISDHHPLAKAIDKVAIHPQEVNNSK